MLNINNTEILTLSEEIELFMNDRGAYEYKEKERMEKIKWLFSNDRKLNVKIIYREIINKQIRNIIDYLDEEILFMKNDNEDELLDVAENLINKLYSITGGKSN